MESQYSKRAGSSLSREIEKVRPFWDNAGLAMFLLDAAGSFLYANDEALIHFGYKQSQLFRKNICQLDQGGLGCNWHDHWTQVKEIGKASVETTHMHSSGVTMPVEIKVHICSMANKDVYCAHVINIRALELVKKAEETKLFAYSVAHDLKNPALAIRALVERFSERITELSDEHRRMYCDRIVDSADQIIDMVEKINAYISSKETRTSFEEVFLKDLIWASRKEFAAQLQYRAIDWHECDSNPVIRMNKFSMIRVFRNLIENALKHGGPQLSRISLGYRENLSHHVLFVQDDGVGLSPEDSERVFRPFERKRSSASLHGSGLGLAIVKEVATNHHGKVWVESKEKKGVRICFAISKIL